MSSSAICKLPTNPTADEIVSFLNTQETVLRAKVLDYNASAKKSYTNSSGVREEYISKPTGYITFTIVNENGLEDDKCVFFIEDSVDICEESSTRPFMPKNHTYLSLDPNESSVKAMELIVSNFGGYIIDDDCTDEDSQEFFRFIDGNGEFAMSEAEKVLLAKLAEVGSKDKYNLMKIIEENGDVLFDYLNEQRDV